MIVADGKQLVQLSLTQDILFNGVPYRLAAHWLSVYHKWTKKHPYFFCIVNFKHICNWLLNWEWILFYAVNAEHLEFVCVCMSDSNSNTEKLLILPSEKQFSVLATRAGPIWRLNWQIQNWFSVSCHAGSSSTDAPPHVLQPPPPPSPHPVSAIRQLPHSHRVALGAFSVDTQL